MKFFQGVCFMQSSVVQINKVSVGHWPNKISCLIFN